MSVPSFLAGPIETSTCFVSLIEEDILRVEFKPNTYVDIEEHAENLKAYKSIMRTERVYMLTVALTGTTLSPEVRDNFASAERASFKIAEAFVISSLAQKLLADFVIRVQKPKHKLKIFRTEKDALQWLMGVRQSAGVQ